MKFRINKPKLLPVSRIVMMVGLLMPVGKLLAQDQDSVPAVKEAPARVKPAKNTFQSVWIIDNQTVMVPIKGTFEMDIQHRFGTVEKGYKNLWGLFSTSNIRIGVSYAPINKLNVGIGITRTGRTIKPYEGPSDVTGPIWDGSVKYSFFTQTKGKYPVSVTYYGNVAYNTLEDPNHDFYRRTTDRFSFFNQLIIARKVTNKLSLQVAPSVSHHNVANGYFIKLNDSTLQAKPDMKYDHFAIAFSARYKLTKGTAFMLNYDQPITKHISNNPNPSLSFGFEFNTSSHSFQLFATNYMYLSPQTNNLYNHNAPFGYTNGAGDKVAGGKFLIGFNITRLWNY